MIRLKILYDAVGWAYYHRAFALQKYAPNDFQVDIGRDLDDRRWDVVFSLMPELAPRLRTDLPDETALICGFNTSLRNPNRRGDLAPALENADLVLFNNASNWQQAGRPEGSRCIANGIDPDVFQVRAPLEERDWKVVWCGSMSHRRTKGYDEFLLPLAEQLQEHGIASDFQLVNSHDPSGLKTPLEMAQWYNSATHYVCASEFEGTPNTALEAAACGCVVVSTPVGDMPELIEHGKSGYLSERDVSALLGWILESTERERHREISQQIRASVAQRHWPRVAPQFFELFRTVHRHRADRRPRASTDARLDEHLMDWMPKSSKRVLAITGDTEATAASLRKYAESGSNAVVAEVAVGAALCPTLDRLCIDSGDERPEASTDADYDCVLCDRSLEVLSDPKVLLEAVRKKLAPNGSLVARVPNVRRRGTVEALLSGSWSPHASIAATSQLTHFTRRELEKLFFRSGFRVERLTPVPNEDLHEWRAADRTDEVGIGGLQIAGLEPTDAEEFYTDEYLLHALADERPGYGCTSIVIVTHNQLHYTRQCINSILQFTDAPIELIIVDNGSTDGTTDYLEYLDGAQVVRNEENRGFPAAANQGIVASTGEQVLLLNNDTIVTTGWLDRMLRALHADERTGLAGPCSNFVSGPQQVPVTYGELTSLDGFAWEWGKAHHGQHVEIDRLVGFCLLIRREVIDRIGMLDEQFGIGNFEDDDFCRRANEAGYKSIVASDAFVHHFGGRTFVGAGVDFDSLMRKNQELYLRKWEKTDHSASPAVPEQQASPRQATKFDVDMHPEGGLRLFQKHVQLSLCMIVRDNERTLDACLESIKPWVDEMIVVDTGSTDDTPQIARRHGARLYHFPWCDDFAAARNESLRHARGDWLFWMDSDDTIDADCGRKLRELASREPAKGVLGYVIQVHCPDSPDAPHQVTVVDHVKMFRNRQDLRFECRIHEQILPAIRRAGGEVAWSDIFVVHSGADHTPEGLERKRQRDLRLLQLELRDRPDHPFALFNLGMTYADIGDYGEAVKALVKSLGVSAPHESHVRKVYALLVNCHAQLGQYKEAWNVCQAGKARFGRDPELAFREGMLAHHFGHYDSAIEAYHRALANNDERHFSSVDPGIVGFKARHNLAVVYVDQGNLDAAADEWRQVVAEAPDYREGWRGLADVLLRKGDSSSVEALAEQMTLRRGLEVEATLVRGRLAAARGDFQGARAAFEQADRQEVDDLEPLRTFCQFLFEHGDPIESKEALKRLVQRAPDDPASYHNLGTVCLQLAQHEEAKTAFRSSLEIRPDSATTLSQLGLALRADGLVQEAKNCWHKALELDASEPCALDALRQISDETASALSQEVTSP